jgi:hypothetical protein
MLAGGIDVALRALGVPYAPLLATSVALAAAAFVPAPPRAALDQEDGEPSAVSAAARGDADHRRDRSG